MVCLANFPGGHDPSRGVRGVDRAGRMVLPGEQAADGLAPGRQAVNKKSLGESEICATGTKRWRAKGGSARFALAGIPGSESIVELDILSLRPRAHQELYALRRQ